MAQFASVLSLMWVRRPYQAHRGACPAIGAGWSFDQARAKVAVLVHCPPVDACVIRVTEVASPSIGRCDRTLASAERSPVIGCPFPTVRCGEVSLSAAPTCPSYGGKSGKASATQRVSARKGAGS